MQEKIESIDNKKCDLITGDESIKRTYSDGEYLVSCTMEKANLNEEFDVAVLDEIQMIGDFDRGNAWTQALLGLKAKVIYLCGDETAIDIVKKFAIITGDELELVKHSRRSYLEVSKTCYSFEKHLRPGDCIITFSTKKALELRDKINDMIKRNSKEDCGGTCSVIYGKLPPDIRKEQARLFNEGVNKYMVATDAIGMG